MFKLGPLANVTTIVATIAANKDYLRKVSREEKEEWINGLAKSTRRKDLRLVSMIMDNAMKLSKK